MGAWFPCLFLKLRRASPAVPSKYVTQIQKYFSHPSLLFSFFPTPPTKLKLGLGILCTAAGYTLQILTYYPSPSQCPMKQHTEIHTKGRWEEQARWMSAHTLSFSLLRARVCKGELSIRGAELHLPRSFDSSVTLFPESTTNERSASREKKEKEIDGKISTQ